MWSIKSCQSFIRPQRLIFFQTNVALIRDLSIRVFMVSIPDVRLLMLLSVKWQCQSAPSSPSRLPHKLIKQTAYLFPHSSMPPRPPFVSSPALFLHISSIVFCWRAAHDRKVLCVWLQGISGSVSLASCRRGGSNGWENGSLWTVATFGKSAPGDSCSS